MVSDFHAASFHELIRPTVITCMTGAGGDIAVRLSVGDGNTDIIKSTLSAIKRQWEEVYPDDPFSFDFLDESIALLFEKERQTAWLTN